jgi:hypothetical protein
VRPRPVHPMLAGVVHTALQVCDGTEYFVEGACESCGGALSGYDTRTKRFAILCDDNGNHTIEVSLHRACCRSCGRIVVPDGPFYAGTRIGAPVADLCRALTMTMTCGRASARLGQMGVVVDRWSVRSYSMMPHTPTPTIAAFGVMVPVSVISLSALAGSLPEGGRAGGEDVLAACRYPSRPRP